MDVLAAGRALHRALAQLERPAFVDERRDGWAEADRVTVADALCRHNASASLVEAVNVSVPAVDRALYFRMPESIPPTSRAHAAPLAARRY